MNIKSLFICIIFFAGRFLLDAQEYVMQNALVTECTGTLTDSDMGAENGQYDHNEDFIFSICVPGATEIVVSFDFFATEADFDILTIYDGPDVNSPVLSSLDGVISTPPVIVATSGCISFHFVSDDNIVAQGWSLDWEVQIDDNTDALMDLINPALCPLGLIDVSISPAVDCQNFIPSNFEMIGPGNPQVSEILIECNMGQISEFQVVFTDSLSIVGDYWLLFSGENQNKCGDLIPLTSQLHFELQNCPFSVEILIDTACRGSCGELEVLIHDTDAGPFEISWSHTSINQRLVEICSDSSTLVLVEITKPNTGQRAEAEIEYTPYQTPLILNAFHGDTFCSSRTNHRYLTSIAGGIFESKIIPDHHQESGVYEFWRWRTSDGLQQDIIRYTDPSACEVDDTLHVRPIYAGRDQALCFSSETISLTGANPADGVWTGQGTTPEGFFTAPGVDTFFLNYTSIDGCTDVKRVFVVNSIEINTPDTLCSNEQIDLRDFVNSLGGHWTGPGIVNGFIGRLRPWQAVANTWNRYYYQTENCIDSTEIYIKNINAGDDLSICSNQEFIQLPFTGAWSGPGVYNPIDSSYYIGALDPDSYEISVRAGNCEDAFSLYIEEIDLEIEGDSSFCRDGGSILIQEFLYFTPYQGHFFGPAIRQIGDSVFFDTERVIGDSTVIYYEALGCTDSVTLFIESQAIIQDYSFCEISGIQELEVDLEGGCWIGNGIIDSKQGLFNPASADTGNFELTYFSARGCPTAVQVELVPFFQVSLGNIQDQYCFKDSNIALELFPSEGNFFINGVASEAILNPAELGSGNHQLEYVTGSGACENRTSQFITVLLPISADVFVLRDSLCPKENTTLFVESSGGIENQLFATWNNNLGFGSSHLISPAMSTLYTVTITDGCSDEFRESKQIFVFDSFEVNFSTGPEVCYGDTSHVEIDLTSDDYKIIWNGESNTSSPVYRGLPSEVSVEITEKSSGCRQNYTAEVPGSEPIGARFSIVPNQECIDIIENEISIIDLAFGYDFGFIEFGDGSGQISLSDRDLHHSYSNSGDYTIFQYVENNFGCVDSFSRHICVKNKVELYMPNVFSPNGDQIHDDYKVFGYGIEQTSLQIYDRWGTKVFEASSLDLGWNGEYKGRKAMTGVYSVVLSYIDSETKQPGIVYSDLTLIR